MTATPSSQVVDRSARGGRPGGVVYQPCQLILNFGLFRRELFESDHMG